MLTQKLSPELEQILSTITNGYRSHLLEFQRGKTDKGPKLNPDTLMRDLSRGAVNGENREACEEAARRDGVQFDALRPYVSFRDLTVASVSGGGYLKGTEVQEAVDILRPWSVTTRAGLMIEMGLQGDQVVPKVTAKTTPEWVSTEGTQISTSVNTVSQISLSPKTVGAVLQYSRQLSKQANASAFAGRELLRTVGTAVDQAVINGTGSSGEPEGLLQNSGVQNIAGAAITGASVNQMKQLSAEAKAPDDAISFLTTPKVRRILEGRERATGSGFVWSDDRISSRPGYVSTDVPTDYLICGAWPLVYLGIWGSGFALEINPYESSNFRSGVIQARVIVSCDVAILQASAFVYASSVS